MVGCWYIDRGSSQHLFGRAEPSSHKTIGYVTPDKGVYEIFYQQNPGTHPITTIGKNQPLNQADLLQEFVTSSHDVDSAYNQIDGKTENSDALKFLFGGDNRRIQS